MYIYMMRKGCPFIVVYACTIVGLILQVQCTCIYTCRLHEVVSERLLVCINIQVLVLTCPVCIYMYMYVCRQSAHQIFSFTVVQVSNNLQTLNYKSSNKD